MTRTATVAAFLLAYTCGLGLGVLAENYAGAEQQEAPGQILGITYCDEGSQRGISMIRLEVIDSPEAQPVMSHEYLHKLVINTFPSCKEYDAWIAKGDNRLRSEAAAMCASARTAAYMGVDLAAAVEKYSGWLFAGYPQFELTLDSAREAVWSFCADNRTNLLNALRGGGGDSG